MRNTSIGSENWSQFQNLTKVPDSLSGNHDVVGRIRILIVKSTL